VHHHDRRRLQRRIPETNRRQNLESAGRRGKARAGTLPRPERSRFPNLPEELTFLHAEEILEMFPDLPRKKRETELLQRYPAVFIIGIGWPLKDGYPHENRAADYDDWSPAPAKKPARKPTASTATSSSGIQSQSAATNSTPWASVSTQKRYAASSKWRN
jgi:hypothetical protein